MTAEELVQKAKDQRKSGRLEEAVIAARAATTLDAENVDAVWQLALCTTDLNGQIEALVHFERVTELAPWFAYGWTRFGLALEEAKKEDRATECFERAIKLDKEDQPEALAALARIYERNKDFDDEARVLLSLDNHASLSVYQLYRLGTLHFQKYDFNPAITYFQRLADELPSDTSGLINLGLVFSSPEVRRNVDAIDSWRRALKRQPENERAKKDISALLPELSELQRQVLVFDGAILDRDQWYANYVNPMRLLGFDEEVDLVELDAKAIQRAKKVLLHEIELEEGRVQWVPGLQIERSRAIGICEELSNKEKRSYHWQVLSNVGLCAFLERGDLNHFFIDEASSAVVLLTIDRLQEDPEGFGSWLSPLFAAQYNSVLSKAIETRNLVALKCLLGGRRWVRPEHEDLCFDGAHRRVDRLLEPLRKTAELSPTTKPTLNGVRLLLTESNLDDLFTLLPAAFHKEKREAAMLVRGISIDAYNHHDDADLAKAILQLTDTFSKNSPSLQHQLAEDQKILSERTAAQRKNEAHLTVKGVACSITREGVRQGTIFIPADDARTVRWGMLTTGSGPERSVFFRMNVGGLRGALINIEWTSSNNQNKQEELFHGLVDAAFSYIFPKVVGAVKDDLEKQKPVQIGGLNITTLGVELAVPGWFSTKKVICPWQRLKSAIANGEIVITDSENSKARASLSVREVDNAIVLHLLATKP